MSRNKSKSSARSNSKSVKLATVPPASQEVLNAMSQQWNTTTYGPSVPIAPYPGLQPAGGPRTWAYTPYNNLNLVVRDNLTPFEILRQFANLYDVIGLCLQVWFDCAANLELDIVPVDGLLGKNETADKYVSDIARYKEFFESPDKEHTLHEWLNAILRDLATIDAVCIYPELTYGGDLNALILIDGSTIKPLLDDRGRTPQPPFYAYEQIVYGAPSEMWTTDDLLYLKEHHRTNSMFGFSRVENIIVRVNQALRKQNLDMSMFTDGNVPAGFISPAADVGWSPEQLMTYQTMFDSLLAGNDAMRSRVKTLPPGGAYVPTNPMVFSSDLDIYTLKVTHASFGVMPSQSGFTDDVNKATAESQGDITYQRTLKPISNRIAKLITYVMNRYMNEKRFKAVFKGYEAQEDFAANATSHVALVGAGIENVNDAARALKLPAEGKEVPRFIVTKTGPFVIDDLANVAVRAAQVEALTQATTQTANDEGAGPTTGGNVADGSGASGPASESSSKSDGKQQEDDGSDEGKAASKGKSKDVVRMARADLAKWRNFAVARIESGKPLRAFVSSDIPTGLSRRIQRALKGCTTPDDVRLVFASVQDRQIAGVFNRYNENHDANGRFGTGDGGESSGGGAGGGGSEEADEPLDASELAHVSGGPVNGVNQVTVSVSINDGTQHFTDSYLPGDVTQIVLSDHVYTFSGTDHALDDAAIEVEDHPESMLQVSNSGTMALFTNNELEYSQIQDLTDSIGVTVNHSVRGDDEYGTYYDWANYPAAGDVTRAEVYTRRHVRKDDGRPFVRASTKKWRQPTPEQLKCEQDLASYLNKLNLSIKRDGKTLNVGALDQKQAAQDILPYLQQAQMLGKQYASHYIERGVGSFVGNLLDMAANLITRDISWFSDLFKQRLEGLDADVGIEEIAAAEDDVVQQVAQQVAETLAVTEVQTVIERMVMQQMDTAGVSQIESVTEPDACETCAMNEDYGPIDIGEMFPSGHTAPPYHNNCRCHVQPATT